MGVLKVETAFRQVLLLDGGINAVLGDRIHPVFAPDSSAWPIAAYRRKKTAPEYNTEGRANFAKATTELALWGPDYDVLCALAEAIEAALVPDEGTVSASYGGDVSTFNFVRLTDYSEDGAAHPNGKGTKLFTCMLEFEVGYLTTVGE